MSASSKPLWFILGLVLGVLAGAGFFILKMNNVGKKEMHSHQQETL